MKNKVRELREKFNMSQEELAQRSGLSRQTISAIENNQLKEISSTTMFKLAHVLNEDIGNIFFTEVVKYTER